MINSKGKSKMSESFQRQSQKNFEFCTHKNCTLTLCDTHFLKVFLVQLMDSTSHARSQVMMRWKMPPIMDGSIATSLVQSLSSMRKVCVHPNMIFYQTLRVQTGEIIACWMNCPGSWHDSRVTEGIYRKLEHETPDGYHIVADSTFPTGHDCIDGRILVPLKAGTKLPVDDDQQEHIITGDKPQFSWSGHLGNTTRKCTIY